MAKKLKKFSRDLNASRRGGEKMRRAVKQFNREMIIYIILVIIAVFCSMVGSGEYDLSSPNANGFSLIYLLLPAYLPLLIIGTICSIAGMPLTAVPGQEAVLLGVCDILLALNAWWIIRFIAAKKQSASLLRSARVFALIMICWGIFQIFCSVVDYLWQFCRLDFLHDFK